jgi:hypothetical protein
MIEAFVTEARDADQDRMSLTRMGLLLTEAERDELDQRLRDLFAEYRPRRPAADAEPWSLFVAIHPDPRPVENPVLATAPRDTIEDDD